MSDSWDDYENEGSVATVTKPKVKKPSMYKVVMLNDDYTTMDFVVHILRQFFQKTAEEANKIMLQIHNGGKGICGLYPYDIAQTKVVQVTDYAKKNDMPLKCVVEKE